MTIHQPVSRAPIGVRLVLVAGVVLLIFSARRWSWLTNPWYRAEWSQGWLALAGFVLVCIGGVLHLHYRETPFSRTDGTGEDS